ncbi:hypothetical protein SAMN05661008_01102 [Alkalithermobacter thermoalcaliphilus JW-YL-7 = DSM 7308]|uniref:DUF111 family protein n=1 Tax=Alkalithermobacter thermoalcaliphilus JW-YL-7 = DSM 7308 TaxID=1121328 RepID=A0A150FPJ9_CLOPD|nr:protein of unknown function DUF111 [[Clostridium] paradoxum JW-YL-7 = DSM 7308]SHK90604.1 hypothetical protein SAMN05661008_01102 [[Clostridium] paradoxum JW-YL-7 = DSM 7308]
MNGEIFSYLYEKLFEIGALDVYTQSIYMKKNRPAVKLSVLCIEKDLNNICTEILKQTTTFGVRYKKLSRMVLERRNIKVKSKFGNIFIKVAYYDGRILKYTPEYEQCKEISKNFNIPIRVVYDEINHEISKYIKTLSKGD